MNVFIEYEDKLYEFIPEDFGRCQDICDFSGTKVCELYAQAKGEGAICHQLSVHIKGDLIEQGYFRKIP